MARIRIVDEWLRSPVSAPARKRAIMVVARSWAEQRVLMRAFSVSEDQTRPTINLHGAELAIGPAGTDPHGEWGIHVEPPVDGRAQELREALQLAARLLAGSKGNPPRLQDEASEFEDRATGMWAPSSQVAPTSSSYYEPAVGAPMAESPVIPSAASSSASSSGAARRPSLARTSLRKTPPFWTGHDAPALERPDGPRIDPRSRRTFRYSGAVAAQRPVPGPRAPKKRAAKTVHGFAGNPGLANKESFARTAAKTMPLGLQLDESERRVLNALGKERCMSATEVGVLLGVDDPLGWMSRFLDKLAELGLDLVAPGDDRNGEPTFVLAR